MYIIIIIVFREKKVRRWDTYRKNYKTEKPRGLARQKTKRGDRKGKLNCSPEIP